MIKWCRKAAEQGNIIAQYNLGYYLEHGIGVPKNRKQAIHWYYQSAQQGYPDAKAAHNAIISSNL